MSCFNIKIILLILFLFAPAIIFADQQSTLNQINQNIQSLQTSLQTEQAKQNSVKRKLKSAEIAESQVNQQLNKTKKVLSLKQKNLQKLQQQTQTLAQSEQQKENELGAQMKAAYLLEQQPYLKRVLDPKNAAQSQRTLMYYHYISETQMDKISALQQNLSVSSAHQKLIQKQYANLVNLKQNQLHNQKNLQLAQAQNQQLITVIDQRIQTKSQKLQALIQDKLRLEQTINTLNQQPVQTNMTHLGFAKLKGKLAWPTIGKIRHAFGTQIAQSELTWEGTVITAPLGQAVHAIAAGRVIFAKFMPGYGLLLIINHGNGYMSLYGQNQNLNVKLNDWVLPNQTIATVGNSSDSNLPGLYFSIRHNVKALNPANWCH